MSEAPAGADQTFPDIHSDSHSPPERSKTASVHPDPLTEGESAALSPAPESSAETAIRQNADVNQSYRSPIPVP